MTTYICKVCNWTGLFPNVTKLKKREKGAKVITYINLCPDCNNEVKDIKK